MGDERDELRPVDDGYDPAEQQAIRQLLGNWSASLTAEPLPAPPDHLWSRISESIDAAGSTGSPAQAVGVPDRAIGAAEPDPRHARRLRALPGGRWTTPLVAASVAGLALVIGANVLGENGSGGGSDDSMVAAGAEPVVAERVTSAEPQVLQAGFVPPARKVMELREDLTSANVAQTVDRLLEDAGVQEPVDVLDMPAEDWQPSADGLTSDPQVLRACVTKVTKVATSQALLVLRASVNGVDAGLIVVPEFMQDMNAMASMDEGDMRRMGRQLGVTTVYVVEPTCGLDAPDHDPTLLTFSFSLTP